MKDIERHRESEYHIEYCKYDRLIPTFGQEVWIFKKEYSNTQLQKMPKKTKSTAKISTFIRMTSDKHELFIKNMGENSVLYDISCI